MIYFFFASVLLIATSATNLGSVREILANLPPIFQLDFERVL